MSLTFGSNNPPEDSILEFIITLDDQVKIIISLHDFKIVPQDIKLAAYCFIKNIVSNSSSIIVFRKNGIISMGGERSASKKDIMFEIYYNKDSDEIDMYYCNNTSSNWNFFREEVDKCFKLWGFS